jgi:hypothetical protein
MPFKLNPILAAGLSLPALADDAALLKQMQEQMQLMQAQIEAMSKKLAAQGEKQEKVVAQVTKSEEDTKARAKAVQLYGQLRLSADSYSDDFGTGTASGSTLPGGKGTTIKSNASRFGIKGEIPTSLTDTSMIYQAEVLYGAADNTANEIQWREAFAGMKGNWGQARLGRFDVAYKTSLTARSVERQRAAIARFRRCAGFFRPALKLFHQYGGIHFAQPERFQSGGLGIHPTGR